MVAQQPPGDRARVTLDARQLALLFAGGLAVGGLAGAVAPVLLVPAAPPVDPNLASDCELRVHRQSTELLDLKERVQATRVAWNRVEVELAPIGGVPSWWASQALLESGQARAAARAATLGVPVLETDCEENPCILIIEATGAAGIEPAAGEVLSMGPERAALALPIERAPGPDGTVPEPPEGAVDPRQIRAAVRSDRQIAAPVEAAP